MHKFRAKSLDTNIWITGSLLITPQGTNIYSEGHMASVDPSSVCMYAGCLDVNDKEIYENDNVDWDGLFSGIVKYGVHTFHDDENGDIVLNGWYVEVDGKADLTMSILLTDKELTVR